MKTRHFSINDIRQDSLNHDSAAARPLPRWLTDQKEGVTLYKPREIVIKRDNSLIISLGITIALVIFLVLLTSMIIKRKKKRNGV